MHIKKSEKSADILIAPKNRKKNQRFKETVHLIDDFFIEKYKNINKKEKG